MGSTGGAGRSVCACVCMRVKGRHCLCQGISEEEVKEGTEKSRLGSFQDWRSQDHQPSMADGKEGAARMGGGPEQERQPPSLERGPFPLFQEL